MNHWTARIWIGIALVVLGVLMLLERVGLLHGVTSLFWGAAFAIGAAYFLYRFWTNMHGEWWAAIPGFALLGLAAESLLPAVLHQWGGFPFLACLGLGFFAVYFADRRWWAIIPGGVLVTLAFVAVLGNFFPGRDTGGFLFLGFGLTFLILAALAEVQWAWIPGVVLLAFGALLGASFTGALKFVWPAALILGGLLLILQFARKHSGA